jgi:hypothetical protein
MAQRCVAQAFGSWREKTSAWRLQRVAMDRVARRIGNGLLRGAFAGWQASSDERRRVRGVARKVVNMLAKVGGCTAVEYI